MNSAAAVLHGETMQEPAAVERARAVVRFAKHCGSPLNFFTVCVTDVEGFELLDWFREHADPRQVNLQLLDAAIDEATMAGDPWMVLVEFRLLGLEIERLRTMH